MGCTSSNDNTVEKQQQAIIEAQLKQSARQNLNNFKILILGTGESGKSTLTRQIRLINNHFFDENERKLALLNLQENVIDSMKSLITAHELYTNAKTLNSVPINSGEKDVESTTSVSQSITSTDDISKNTVYAIIKAWKRNDKFTKELAEGIKFLFHTLTIQAIYNKRSKFWILDSCEYYVDNCHNYTSDLSFSKLTDEDLLRARIRTTGVEENIIKPAGFKNEKGEDLSITLVDIGGQKSERRKWASCFEHVNSLFFVVNLNSYNQITFEDKGNKLLDSLKVFKEICENPIFKDTNIILWFTKKDKVVSELSKTPIDKVHVMVEGKRERAFPDFEKKDYTGDVVIDTPINDIRKLTKNLSTFELTSSEVIYPYHHASTSPNGTKTTVTVRNNTTTVVQKNRENKKSDIDYIIGKFNFIRKETQGKMIFVVNSIKRVHIEKSFTLVCEYLKNRYNDENIINREFDSKRVSNS